MRYSSQNHPLMAVIHPHSGETKTIDQKNPNQAYRALGWMMTIDGKLTTQFNVLKAKARLFIGAILQRCMQR
jgi:hypothetical protein